MISIVIPVYNERDSLDLLHREIMAVVATEKLDVEILFVDDGSSDGSWDTIRDLGQKHPNVRALRFRKNFGKAAALFAAFRRARGEFILTLDADLQDDPQEIPRFLAALEGSPVEPREGSGPAAPISDGPLDVISGWKKIRHDPWHKVGPSRIFNWLVSTITGVKLHDHNCGMKAYRSAIFREVRLYGELHRFIPVLAAARGYKVGEIVIHHRPRRFGSSKYGFRRFVKGFLDLLTVKFLTGFGQRPQHLLGTVGLISFVLGNVGLIYLTITWIINQCYPAGQHPFPELHQRPLVVYSVAALLLGAQMMSIGLIAEMITHFQGGDEDAYSIAEEMPPRTNDPNPNSP